MRLAVIHETQDYCSQPNTGLLRFAVTTEPISQLIIDSITQSDCFNTNTRTLIALPQEWHSQNFSQNPDIVYYNGSIDVFLQESTKSNSSQWFILSNGRFVTDVDFKSIEKILAQFDNDIIAIDVDPELMFYHEKVRITCDHNLAGFRRQYHDAIVPTATPTTWPAHLFIKIDLLDKIAIDGKLPIRFSDFVTSCLSNSLGMRCFKLGGRVLDIQTEVGLIDYIRVRLNSDHYHSNLKVLHLSPDARIFGKVLFGDNVEIAENAIIIGPAIISDNVKIAESAVIRSSVIAQGLSVPKGSIIQNRILTGIKYQKNPPLQPIDSQRISMNLNKRANTNFRTWTKLSYARCIKRIADIVVSLVLLILFLPLFPVIAVVIKLNSSGPVFFRHKRQGLHGKDFYCLKFTTMICGADKIQHKLRSKNQVDGPQFKVQDDPRVTVVGRFLRETFIDEIPQFINVLLGQMSVIGPRPSPESENLLCPFWRDGRLSVRPGITGLWQVQRTRQPGRDFQEWIYYDTKYVRNLSLRLDLFIFAKTIKKIVKNFIKQF